MKNDYHTRTVSGAAAFARRHAEPDYDDRPTASELAQEEFEDNLECPECGAGYSEIEMSGSECSCKECKCEWELTDPNDGGGGCGGCSPSGYCACIMG